MNKWEEYVRVQLRDEVDEYVKEYYGVEDTEDLTAEQITEIQEFVDLPENQFSMICDALTSIVEWWESS